jgi:benzoate/toluate 1,2-dioxygenase subunit beta
MSMQNALPPASGWPCASEDVWLPSAQEIEQDPRRSLGDFLIAEAAMLDAGDLDRWLELFSPDALYWVPLVWDAGSPSEQLNLIYDDLSLLSDRVFRIQTGDAHSQDPPARVVRALTNFRCRVADGDPRHWVSHTTFSLSELRKDHERTYRGRYTHVLRTSEQGFRIVKKRTDLSMSDGVLPSLTFLL